MCLFQIGCMYQLQCSVIGIKVSTVSIDMVSRGNSFSLVERCNRAFTKSNPNHRIHAHVSPRRVHSSIGRVNNIHLKIPEMKF